MPQQPSSRLLPLHQDAQDADHSLSGLKPNLGLYYQKYFNWYNADASGFFSGFFKSNQHNNEHKAKKGKKSKSTDNSTNGAKQQDHKGLFIDQILAKSASHQPSLTIHEPTQFLVKALGGQCFDFQTTSSLAVGAGMEHPLENNLFFHPTWGVPYIPGSTIKGALRHFFTQYLEEKADAANNNESKQTIIQRIFGSDQANGTDEPAQSQPDQSIVQPTGGQYIFFDALPKKFKLCKEIMTPHFGDWYAKGADIDQHYSSLVKASEVIPADWHDPNPICFLGVATQSVFQFAFAPNPGIDPAHRDEDLQLISQALEQQLKHFGMGAKTATGLGYFSAVQDEPTPEPKLSHQQRQQKQRQLDRINAQKKQEQLEIDKKQAQLDCRPWQKQLIEKGLACIEDDRSFFITNPNQIVKDLEKHGISTEQMREYLSNNKLSLKHKLKGSEQSYKHAKKNLKKKT